MGKRRKYLKLIQEIACDRLQSDMKNKNKISWNATLVLERTLMVGSDTFKHCNRTPKEAKERSAQAPWLSGFSTYQLDILVLPETRKRVVVLVVVMVVVLTVVLVLLVVDGGCGCWWWCWRRWVLGVIVDGGDGNDVGACGDGATAAGVGRWWWVWVVVMLVVGVGDGGVGGWYCYRAKRTAYLMGDRNNEQRG